MININISINSSKQMASENLTIDDKRLRIDINNKIVRLIVGKRFMSDIFPEFKEFTKETVFAFGKDNSFSCSDLNAHKWRKKFRTNHGMITLKGAIQMFLDKLPNCFPIIVYCKSVDRFVLIGLQIYLFDEDTIVDDDINVPFYFVDRGKSIFSAVIIPGEGIKRIIKNFPSLEEKFRCIACGDRFFDKLKFCTCCRKVRYCSKKCQKGHWKEHKKVCNK